MRGVLPWLVRWAWCAGTRDFCPALAALVGPVQNIFSSLYTISIHLSPLPSKLGRQPCCLLVRVSGQAAAGLSLSVFLSASKIYSGVSLSFLKPVRPWPFLSVCTAPSFEPVSVCLSSIPIQRYFCLSDYTVSHLKM